MFSQREKELQAKADAAVPAVVVELVSEMSDRGINSLDFKNGHWGSQQRSTIEGDNREGISVEPDKTQNGWNSYFTGDVCIVIDSVYGYSKSQTYRRRKDGTFNWAKIADKISSTRQSISAKKAADESRNNQRNIEAENRKNIEDLKDLRYYVDIKTTSTPDQYDFETRVRGLSRAQLVGLAVHIKEWTLANGIDWR